MFFDFLFYSQIKKIIGIALIFLVGYFFSEDRKNIDWKRLIILLGFTFILAGLLLKFSVGVVFLEKISNVFVSIYSAANSGIEFVFGALAKDGPLGFIFAIRVLPVIIFFSALISVLYYLQVIQYFVYGLGKLFHKILGTTGPETLCTVANSFLGQTEAPLLIKSYLKSMVESEIFTVMVSGMGTLSAGIIAVYGYLGLPLNHLLISSVLSIPSTILISKLWYPNKSKKDSKNLKVDISKEKSFFMAIGKGTSEGLFLAMNVGAMLIVMISLLFCIDNILLYFGSYINNIFDFDFEWTLSSIFSYIAYPFVWGLNLSKMDTFTVAGLVGTKVCINEMIAYLSMLKMNLAPNVFILATYMLCGFSNFSCIGIQLGGIGGLEESTKPTIAKLGIKAVFAAAFSNLLITYIVSFFI